MSVLPVLHVLPREIYFEIFKYVDPETMAIAANACRLFYYIWHEYSTKSTKPTNTTNTTNTTNRRISIAGLVTPSLVKWAVSQPQLKTNIWRVILGRQGARVGTVLPVYNIKDTRTVDIAVQNQNIPLLAHLKALNWQIYRANASNAVIKWYHTDGCPWGRRVSGKCPLRTCFNFDRELSVKMGEYQALNYSNSSGSIMQIVAYGAQDVERPRRARPHPHPTKKPKEWQRKPRVPRIRKERQGWKR